MIHYRDQVALSKILITVNDNVYLRDAIHDSDCKANLALAEDGFSWRIANSKP